MQSKVIAAAETAIAVAAFERLGSSVFPVTIRKALGQVIKRFFCLSLVFVSIFVSVFVSIFVSVFVSVFVSCCGFDCCSCQPPRP